ncbi:MAG TPA: protein phosphatase 2C domain-containing protein [Ktedonobacteraceae bacterium]
MSSKIPHLSYPGELPDLNHQTISLRTQLRLSYETYSWVRYLIWSSLLLLAVLLLLLPGGVPPQVAVLFWQTLLVIGRLIELHGSAALFSLGALGVQTLTWLVLWLLLLGASYKLGRYTWQQRSAQKILAAGWLSSSALSNGNTPVTHARTAPLNPRLAPFMSLPTPGAGPAKNPQPQPAPGQSAAWVHNSGAPLVRSLSEPSTQLLTRPLASNATQTPTQQLLDTPSQSQARQFAQLAAAPGKLPSMPSGDFSSNWSLHPVSSAPGIAWDRGIKRKGRPNEDSVLTMHGTCNFDERLLPFELHIVADGMGGHAQGRLASHLAIRSMLETIIPGLVGCNEIAGEQIVDILIDGVHWANQVIYQYGQENNADMGTTVTAVLVLDEAAYIINVGDSRTYIYRPNAGLTQITRDHSLVARMVETGAITPDEIYTHPDRNKVYRGLGDKTDITVDWFVLPVQANDLLLLCSDGLWEMVRDPQISDILQTYASSPALASNALLRAALQAGGSDNVSTLVVRVA